VAEQNEKDEERIEHLKEVVARLKEMEHYSEANIEKLGADWFLLGDELKETAHAERIDALLTIQNQFQEAVAAMIKDVQIDINKREQGA
jgi:hypothetical protein